MFQVSLKNQYTRRLSHFAEVISILVGLTVYYYISAAFDNGLSKEANPFEGRYFDYVVFGEIFMMLPLYFLDAPYQKLKSSIMEGTFLVYIGLPIGLNKLILIFSSWNLVQTLKRVLLTLLFSITIFGLNFEIISLVKIVLLQIVSIFVFLGLGLCLSCLLLFFGRGAGAIGYLNTFVAISAGSFFPLSVLPEWLASAFRAFSPFTLMLESSRLLNRGALTNKDFLRTIAFLALWGIVFLIGRKLFALGIRYYRKNGSLKIISQY